MKKNMGSTDRFIRLFLAVIFVGLYATSLVTGTVAIVLGVVAAIFVLTSLVGVCPLYSIFGMNTCITKLEKKV